MPVKVYAMIQVRVDPDLRQWIVAQAVQRGISFNAVVCALLAEARARTNSPQERAHDSHPSLV